MAQNHPITIEGIAPDNSLILSDKGHTNVEPGDTVTWLIKPNSGVKAIAGISKKENSVNVFISGPNQVGNSNNWRGTVDPDIPRGSVEDYNILWTATSGGGVQVFDPKIQVNS